jgi:alpha 1,3-glucosidase
VHLSTDSSRALPPSKAAHTITMGINLHQGPLALLLILLCNNSAFQHPPITSHTTSLLSNSFPSLTKVMAVDHSKFRTCHQTSFCRRHRHGKSKSLYEYKLLPETVVFDPSGIASVAASETTKGLLSSWSRKLTKGSSLSNGDNYQGPPPVLTAKLHNIAAYTSCALTADAYGSCPQEEELEVSISLLQDGVARVRIVEAGAVITKKGPRWTADDLVLNAEEMAPFRGEEVRLDSLNSAVDSDKMKKEEDLIASLVKRAHQSFVSATVDLDNFMVLSYGEEWKLMIQMHPFAVYFFRGNTGPPVIVAGSSGLTHFEVRRDRDCEEGSSSNEKKVEKRKLLPTEEEEIDRHGGKEIVGYWEDGLAIYADGTREEKKLEEEEETEEEEVVDRGEGKEERRLEEEAYDTEGMWTEKFSSHTDSKPHGPMSVGMEIVFPRSSHLFGLPEHASSAQLKTTAGSEGHHYYKEPYRLYNLDVFEYELDETMALYGHVPLVISQSESMGTAGAFWFNPTETFVDVEEVQGENDVVESRTHFMSESGVIDLFLMPGPDPHALYEQYARLTGRMPLPPMFSLGYHQCRWNYRDEADVYFVHGKFEELDYPYDVLWLDIEHTDGKRYFTWDKKLFPNPADMQNKLAADGRRMVTIIDPHIKTDNNYYIHKEATSLGLYIKNKDYTKDYDGWCWPGSSSYLDFTAEKVRNWWADQFQYNKYKGSTPSLFTWNDMNEPSVFNGPEVSMQKDLLNLDKVEHREWHNLYGMLFHRSTTEGQIKRNAGHNVRPFVLSRSFFAGSQKYGAIWTGDNAAQWSHLEIATPMLLGLNIGAISFSGADVGGFFGNTDAELMTRWMQAGAYQPFFRGHAHHDAKRREPWVFGDETMVRLRRAAMARYALLPYWYTVFWNAGVTGMPVMR